MSLTETAPVDPKDLRVLVVEDEFMVASLLEDYLIDLGCDVVGPAATADKAIDLIDGASIDVAILDINLNPGTSEPVARRLIEADIPFIFVTGYSDLDLLSSDLRDMWVVQKPVHAERFGQIVRDLAARAQQRS